MCSRQFDAHLTFRYVSFVLFSKGRTFDARSTTKRSLFGSPFPVSICFLNCDRNAFASGLGKHASLHLGTLKFAILLRPAFFVCLVFVTISAQVLPVLFDIKTALPRGNNMISMEKFSPRITSNTTAAFRYSSTQSSTSIGQVAVRPLFLSMRNNVCFGFS